MIPAPLLAAMPDMLSPGELTRAIQSLPVLLASHSPEELALLSIIFIPMDRMYNLCDIAEMIKIFFFYICPSLSATSFR